MQLLSRKPLLIQLSVFLVYFLLPNVLRGIVGSFASVPFCSTKKGPTQAAVIQEYENKYLPSAIVLAVQTKRTNSMVCGMSCQRQKSCNAFHFKKKPSPKNNCVLMKVPPKKSEWTQSLVADTSGTLFHFVEEQCYFGPVVHGSWTTWSVTEPLTATCGSGTESFSRSCTAPALSNGGRDCLGTNTQTRTYTLVSCAVHGNWGPWEQNGSECYDIAYFGCSCPKCMQKIRHCDNPAPVNGGNGCVGPNKGLGVDGNSICCPF